MGRIPISILQGEVSEEGRPYTHQGFIERVIRSRGGCSIDLTIVGRGSQLSIPIPEEWSDSIESGQYVSITMQNRESLSVRLEILEESPDKK